MTSLGGCTTDLDLFPATGDRDQSTGGGQELPHSGGSSSAQGGFGGTGSGEGGATFPTPPGEPTLLQLNTDAPCPDDISFTDDLLEMVFDSEEGTLLTSRRESQLSPWSPAVEMSEIGLPGLDSGAEISHDGLSIWWMSERLNEPGDGRLWFSTRTTRSSPWEAPTLAEELDGPLEEAFPTVTDDSLLMVFVTDRDLYATTRASVDAPWGAPEPLGVVNTRRADTGPAITGNGLSLYFVSTRNGGQGSTDLYVAHRDNRSEDFGEPEPLTDLNTPASEGDPWISSDGQFLVFFRSEGADCAFYSVKL